MIKQPIPLTPAKVRVLVRCPLHYHFLEQSPTHRPDSVDRAIREAIQQLHAAGGPARLSLADCLKPLSDQREARSMVEGYYHHLKQDWTGMIAGNETMQLRISIGRVSLALQATVDRLDKTSDGGILAILFRSETGPVPAEGDLQQDHAMTIYHALVAATYPLKRPVRIQEWWLRPDQRITIELSEEEYRRKLSDLREPVKALARSEVMARPGLHCETCRFKHRGCPVFAHEEEAKQDSLDDLVPSPERGKISPRKWVFKI